MRQDQPMKYYHTYLTIFNSAAAKRQQDESICNCPTLSTPTTNTSRDTNDTPGVTPTNKRRNAHQRNTTTNMKTETTTNQPSSTATTTTTTTKGSTKSLKILIIGDQRVGKSSVLMRFTDDRFDPDTPSTIGVDYKSKNMGK